MKRKIASIFLALAMILSLIPGTVFAGEGAGDTLASLSDTIVDSGTFGEDGDNLTWSLSTDGTLTINGTGGMGYQAPWMSYRDSIKSLVVEEGVTTVGQSAFSGCDQLTSATLPTSLTEIGQSAFLGCFNLEKICLPDTLNAIGDNAFGSAWDTAFFFTGSEEQWNAVTIGSGNEPLENKKIHFNATYHTYDENGICTVCGYAGPDHTNHVMSDWYWSNEIGHWKICIYCEKPMTETEAHVFDEDGICTVCGYARAGHTHQMADWYCSDVNGHWRGCKYCNEPMTETQGHSYDESGICTICRYAGPDHTNHVISGMYWNDENGHWKACIYCGELMTETEEHIFEGDGICSVCGYVKVNHTHKIAYWYDSDANGHWRGCRYCEEPMTETQGHSYDENGICTICEYAGPGHTNHAMSDWYWNDETGHWKACIYCGEPMTEIKEHVFDEDGICSTCGYAKASHTHKAAEDYGCDADGHWSICRFCGRQIGRVQAHDYAYSRCKVCGQYEADHVHSYAWLAEDSEHWQECEICYTAVNKGNHTFVNNVCEECGLLDPSLVPESIAVSINQNKQMTTVLTFTNGSSRELTITGIDILKGDEKNFSGVIYTKEGVLLGGDYWLMSNEAGQYTIEYRLYTGAKVLGNFVDSREWVKLGELAKKQGIVAADCTYANGVWTVTGKAYDGQRAVMTLNDNLTVLNYTIGEDEIVKTSGIVTVSDAKAKPGKTVTVKVDLSANKGISNMRLQMSCPEGFTLENIQKGDALSSLTFTPPGKLTANPVNFVWDGTEADTSEGCILELTFRIADTVAVGEYSISLSYQKDDVLDGSLEGIDLALQSGTVSVVEFTRGDIDGDGVIGMKDLGALRKYFAGGYDAGNFVMEAADLDGDGVVTMKDLGVLRRYLAGGYDINLGE